MAWPIYTRHPFIDLAERFSSQLLQTVGVWIHLLAHSAWEMLRKKLSQQHIDMQTAIMQMYSMQPPCHDVIIMLRDTCLVSCLCLIKTFRSQRRAINKSPHNGIDVRIIPDKHCQHAWSVMIIHGWKSNQWSFLDWQWWLMVNRIINNYIGRWSLADHVWPCSCCFSFSPLMFDQENGTPNLPGLVNGPRCECRQHPVCRWIFFWNAKGDREGANIWVDP